MELKRADGPVILILERSVSHRRVRQLWGSGHDFLQVEEFPFSPSLLEFLS